MVDNFRFLVQSFKSLGKVKMNLFDSILITTVISCFVLGLTNGFLGSFLVLRRLSLFGDVIGHAVLPGICIGFVLAGFTKSIIYLFIGASGSILLASLVLNLFTNRF